MEKPMINRFVNVFTASRERLNTIRASRLLSTDRCSGTSRTTTFRFRRSCLPFVPCKFEPRSTWLLTCRRRGRKSHSWPLRTVVPNPISGVKFRFRPTSKTFCLRVNQKRKKKNFIINNIILRSHFVFQY